mgnify:CR=1 FL=1
MYYVNVLEFKAEMARNNYNITTLSHKMGVCRETVSRVLNGENPTYPFMCKSMEILKLPKEKAADIFFATKLT